MSAARFLALLVVLGASACSGPQRERVSACLPKGVTPPVAAAAGTGRASTTLSVLTFNVEGLPWPARSKRTPQLREIGRELAVMRADGEAPDVVLLQEAFSSKAASIGARAGYANYLKGPAADVRRPPTSEGADPSLVDKRKRIKGEGWRPILSGGLYILSDYPLVEVDRQPFRKRECAGFDCLANKGVMHARVAVPGVPSLIDVFNTHLNSRGSAHVSRTRSARAHKLQVDELHRYVEERWDKARPLIIGGDLNMRRAPDRFEHFATTIPYTLVHQYCRKPEAHCDVRISWDGDAPWMDTQDLQAFESGSLVRVEPIRVEAMFDKPWHGETLSDHDGFLVVYRLSWPVGAPQAPAIPRCG